MTHEPQLQSEPHLHLVSSQEEPIPEELNATRAEIEMDEHVAHTARIRRQGADITADKHRAETLSRAWTRVKYGAAILLAVALVYEGANAAGSQEDHAPNAPAHLAKKLRK